MNTVPILSTSSKIKYLRKNNGLSLDDLAAKLEITLSNLEDIEAGNAAIDPNLLEKFSFTLQVPLSYLSGQHIQDNDSLNYLTRAMEKLSQNDHDELLQFAEFLQTAQKEK